MDKHCCCCVPQDSILDSLLLLVYINDLPNEFKYSVKLITDDIVKHKNESANSLTNNLLLISKWAYNWKIVFNPDPSKLAQEVLFSRKTKIQIYRTIIETYESILRL